MPRLERDAGILLSFVFKDVKVELYEEDMMMRLNKKILTITTVFVLMFTAVFSACRETDNTNYVGTVKIGYMRAGYGIEFA